MVGEGCGFGINWSQVLALSLTTYSLNVIFLLVKMGLQCLLPITVRIKVFKIEQALNWKLQ